jgi:hypothetical protein
MMINGAIIEVLNNNNNNNNSSNRKIDGEKEWKDIMAI